MNKTLNISDEISLPIDAVTGTFCIVGIRGSGKSNTGVVFAEEMLRAKQQIVALDPKDDWWGMRSAADGVSEGFPVTILGGTHQDAPLEHTAGALVAQLAIEEKISLIVSTKHLSDGHRFRFTYDFCDYLYKHCREPMHLFLDEADQFAPQERQTRIQKGDSISEAMMLSLVRRVIKQGRTSGLGISLITQSPATLDKRVMNMCETLIAMRVVGAQDFDAVERWFKVYLRKKTDLEEIVSKLPTLKAGVGVFYSPFWLKESRIVRFRMAETFDSRKTPKVGERRVEPKVLAPVDLAHLSDRMKATIEKARTEDPKELRRLNAELRSRITALEYAAQQRILAKPTTTIVEKPVTRIVEKPIIKDSQIKRLETLAGALGKRLDGVTETTATLREFKLSLDGILVKAANLNGHSSPVEESVPIPPAHSLRERQTEGFKPTHTVRQVTAQLDRPLKNSNSNGDEEYDMAEFEEFYQRTVQRLQQDGFAVTVKVEPKEVVLKEFQQAQVTRILAAAAELSEWQKSVIRFMEARGTRATKKDIFTAIVGKEPSGGSGQQDRYKAIDEITDAGWLSKDAGFVRGNLTANISSQLQHYNATEQEVEDVAGQVLLRLK